MCLVSNYSSREIKKTPPKRDDALSWRNPKMSSPKLISDLERLVACSSSCLTLTHSSILLTFDDELLRCKSHRRRRQGLPFKVQDIKKSIGVQGTSLGSPVTGLIYALHYSVPGEPPELTAKNALITLSRLCVSRCEKGATLSNDSVL